MFPSDEMALQSYDLLNAIKYILKLRASEGELDDIDHLGNRRVRTIDELAAEGIAQGFPQAEEDRHRAYVQPRSAGNDPSFADQSKKH